MRIIMFKNSEMLICVVLFFIPINAINCHTRRLAFWTNFLVKLNNSPSTE